MSLPSLPTADSSAQDTAEHRVIISGFDQRPSESAGNLGAARDASYLKQLRAEAPTPGKLIEAMDRYLYPDQHLDAFAIDHDLPGRKKLTLGMQRITKQALLLQHAPSLETFRDKLVEYLEKHIADSGLRAQQLPPRRQTFADAVKVPTVFSLLKFMVAIFGGPRQDEKESTPPLDAAALDAFIRSLKEDRHILSPGMDTTGQLVRLLTRKKPEEVLAALRDWAPIDLSPFEQQFLKEDPQERESGWKRLRKIATAVPEKESLKDLLINVFPDPVELDLFSTVAFPRTYHRAARSSQDRAEALVRWVWTGLVWEKLQSYLGKETLAPHEKNLTMRSDLQKLSVWGSLMAAGAIISSQLEEIRQRLAVVQEKHKTTLIGAVAAVLLSGIALLYICNPLHGHSPVAPKGPDNGGSPTVPVSPDSTAQRAMPAQSSPSDQNAIVQPAPGCTVDGFCREVVRSTPHNLRRVFGTPDGHVFAAGDSGTLLHFDGANWNQVSLPLPENPAPLVGLYGTSATDVWVAGHNGTLLHFGMSGWEPQTVTAPADLQALWGSDSSLWAVGQKGAILQHQADAWLPVPIENDNKASLSTLFGTGPSDLWAVGSAGTILHFDGSKWSSSPSGTQRPLHAVWGSSHSDIWAVGEYGTILHFDGKAWQPKDDGAPWFANALYGVWGHGARDVWAVGTKGLVLHFDGKLWHPLASGAQSPLRDVWISTRGEIWVVGNEGLILRRPTAG